MKEGISISPKSVPEIGGPLEPKSPTNANIELPNTLAEEEKDLVSFGDVLGAASYAVDAMEHSIGSVNTPAMPRKRLRRQPVFSSESSETEYTSDRAESNSMDSPMEEEEVCQCVCSHSLGLHDVIVLSSDSLNNDVEIL